MTHEPEDSERLSDAFALAAHLHAGQTRKGTGIPYLSHLLAVAALVMENGGDADQVIAALLHDGPEDRGGEATLAEIRQRFGERVARIVLECSDTFETPKPPWRARKEQYIGILENAAPDTYLVSIADKVHNLGTIVRDYRELGEALWQRFTKDGPDVLWYYSTLLEIYETRQDPQLVHLSGQLRALVDTFRQLLPESSLSALEERRPGPAD